MCAYTHLVVYTNIYKQCLLKYKGQDHLSEKYLGVYFLMLSLQILSLRFHKCESCFLKLRLTPNIDPTMRKIFSSQKDLFIF